MELLPYEFWVDADHGVSMDWPPGGVEAPDDRLPNVTNVALTV